MRRFSSRGIPRMAIRAGHSSCLRKCINHIKQVNNDKNTTMVVQDDIHKRIGKENRRKERVKPVSISFEKET